MDPNELLDPLFEAAVADNKYPGLGATIVDKTGKRLYHKAFGLNNISEPDVKFTTSTPVPIWSCTKLVTSIATLQLMEQGKIGLDDPVSKYLPEIKDIEVFAAPETGSVETRKAKTEMTVRHLMTHTAGFTYDFFDKTTLAWRIARGQQPVNYLMDSTKKYFTTPLLFDPGTKFHYGINTDWLGLVIEAITGQRLEEYIKKNILDPLGMTLSVPYVDESTPRLVTHIRGESGKDPLTPVVVLSAPKGVEICGGGQYLISTLDDYSILMATLLNEGKAPGSNHQILRPGTVNDYVFTNHLPPNADTSELVDLDSAVPTPTNSGRYLPTTKLGWSCGLCLNFEDVPDGRRAGSGGWAGLGNLYYFIDRKSERAAMIATSVFPFFDEGVLALFDAVERVAVGDGNVKGMGVGAKPKLVNVRI